MISSSLSTHSTTRHMLDRIPFTSSRWLSSTSSAYTPAAPSPTSDGVFGMTLTTDTLPPPSHSLIAPTVVPAATLMMIGFSASLSHAPRSSSQTLLAMAGLTAITTTCAPVAASTLDGVTVTPRAAWDERVASLGAETET